MSQGDRTSRLGWGSVLARLSMGIVAFEAVSGLAVTFSPFHPAVQWGLVLHTLLGVAFLIPLLWYYTAHWLEYRRYALTQTVLLGYVGVIGLLICALSGVVVTWQGFFGLRTSPAWRTTHLVTTFVALIPALWHVGIALARQWSKADARPVRRYVTASVVASAAPVLVVVGLTAAYSGTKYVNAFPEDYNFLYGEDRPFAPSLARTSTNGAFDSRSLAGSESCGTEGCHSEILEEWKPSAHRYAAMDTLFLGIQNVMAKQNGAESTRYCGGCHDPISLFSGTKNIFVENLTGLAGYQEGVSCLACHAIRETDVQGNANYVVTQPAEYLWQWDTQGTYRVLRDFLIRAYPAKHNELSKRMYKAPEYCAACHKQFIDEEVNRVGWVQLQNQYDNWKASHWNSEDDAGKRDATKTVECRECHMPLVDSKDPASGDSSDYNRKRSDGKHRSHRFIASNQMMPQLLKLPGWEKQVELTAKWLEGKMEIPEIADKWASGPIVRVDLDVPNSVKAGQPIPIKVLMTSNKVGHDYPTGPLDIIQSWLEVTVTDDSGNTVFSSGKRDERNFIESGSFLFKAEPVDQYGNLIDRHNLWEMVGVRYRRALFPGHSDVVEYSVMCPSGVALSPVDAPKQTPSTSQAFTIPSKKGSATYTVTVSLLYRKVDQFLLNYLLGEKSGISAPSVEVARTTKTVEVNG